MPETDSIKAEAASLGFLLSGITLSQKPTHFDQFKGWVEAGRQGQLDYLARPESLEKRANPARVLEGCKSILSLGLFYSSPIKSAQPSQAGEISGKVAAYAWGDDYHSVLPPRLERLAQKISSILGRPIRQRFYTDTGPILERDLAQVAGLGWIGKNTCLIAPNYGSFFLLAELMLDVDLDPDPPFTFDRCGRCRRCIEACPTRCILPDRTIDATRCISYLTIEAKGSIPAELRTQVGDWVFGCDVCQEVCPWNLRFSIAPVDPSFAPRPDYPRPTLLAELKLTPTGFNQKFKNSPILRAHRRGYLRNVCVALGNQPDSSSVKALAEVLANEAEPLVRSHAAWALGRIPGRAARQALDEAEKSDPDASVLAEIRQALAGFA